MQKNIVKRNVSMTYRKFAEGKKHPDKNDENEYTSLDPFPDMGAIIPSNTVIIDLDNVSVKTINNIIMEFDIQTQVVWTDRGAHLWFLKPDGYRNQADYVCNLGLHVEAKVAKRKANTITMKRHGVVRDIQNEGDRQYLPEIFMPIGTKRQQEGMDMSLVEAGQRNMMLFKFGCKIDRLEDWQKITSFVNEHIMPQPMDSNEVDSIIASVENRAGSERESEEFYLAKQLIESKRILKYRGHIWYLVDEEFMIWDDDKSNFQRMVADSMLGAGSQEILRVIKSIELRCPSVHKDQILPIRLRNGELFDGEFIFGQSRMFTPYYLDVEYDPDAEITENVEDYLTKMTGGEPEFRDLIGEIFGHCFINDPTVKSALGRFFIMYGTGANGKGTFLKMIKKVLGGSLVSSLSIDQLTKEQYSNQLIGRLANCGDDVEDKPIKEDHMKMLKNLATCDEFMLRNLYGDAFSTLLTCTLIFSSNHLFKSFEKGTSFKRRVLWLPIQTPEVKKKDLKFLEKITREEDIQFWIKFAIDGYLRLYANGDFTQSDIVREFNEDYHKYNDHTISYCEERGEEFFFQKTIRPIKDDYLAWCEDHDETPYKNTKKLKEQIHKRFGLINTRNTRIDGIVGAYFVKEKPDEE